MPARRVILAEYFFTEDTILLFGFRADWEEPQVEKIKADPSSLRALAGRLRQRQAEKEKTPRSVWRKLLDSHEWQTDMLPFIKPLLSWADPEDHLCLVPHDVLHYLPLHAVHVEGDYLIERNPVSYIPSASVLKYCQAKRKPRDEWGVQPSCWET